MTYCSYRCGNLFKVKKKTFTRRFFSRDFVCKCTISVYKVTEFPLFYSNFFRFIFHSFLTTSVLTSLFLYCLCVLFLFCAGHTQAIDSFVSESVEVLSTRPESIEEIGDANNKYKQILAHKSEVRQTHAWRHACRLLSI